MTVIPIVKGQKAVNCPKCGATYTNLADNTTAKDCSCKKCLTAFKVKRS